jgi:uncharacterized protein YaiL (DUF2058 family)
MANSLHEQLLKAGLVDQQKLKQVKSAKRKQQKQQRKSKEVVIDEAKLAAQQAAAEKAERDRELNRQLKEQAERKAIAAQIEQLITLNRLPREGDIAYNFVDQNKVKRIYVTEAIRDKLSEGLLAIVSLKEQYEVVPAKVAEKIRQRDEACVILCNDRQADLPDEDDPYADYKIPDDLMW